MFDYVLMAAAFRLDRITIGLRVSCIEDSVLPLIVEMRLENIHCSLVVLRSD